MIRIAICDDEHYFAEKLRGMMLSYRGAEIEVFSYQTRAEILKDDIRFDVVFMDVYVEDENGMEIAEKITRINPSAFVIYMSSYADFYSSMVRARPFDFLSKPISQNELFRSLDKVVYHYNHANKKLIYTYRDNRTVKRVDLKDVIEISAKYKEITLILTGGRKIEFAQDQKFDDIVLEMKELNPNIVQIKRNQAINTSFITEFNARSFKIEDKPYTVGRKYQEEYKRINLF